MARTNPAEQCVEVASESRTGLRGVGAGRCPGLEIAKPGVIVAAALAAAVAESRRRPAAALLERKPNIPI